MVGWRNRMIERLQAARSQQITLGGRLDGYAGGGCLGVYKPGQPPDVWQTTISTNEHGAVAIYFTKPIMVVQINQCHEIGDILVFDGWFISPDLLDNGKSRPAFYADRICD